MIDLDIHKSVKNDTLSGIILAEYPALLPYGVHKTRLVKRQKKPASYAVFGNAFCIAASRLSMPVPFLADIFTASPDVSSSFI